ncbi:MAG: hypothetical protein DRI30_02010, partial [Chloroflexi bacterium]
MPRVAADALLGVAAVVEKRKGPGGGARILPAPARGRGEVPAHDGDGPALVVGALVRPLPPAP